jgi:predicted TIM-barrel fold metal-dependent hydrolase
MTLSRRSVWLGITAAGLADAAPVAARAAPRLPILDMHVHALAADDQGPPPLAMCAPFETMPGWDPQQPFPDAFLSWFKSPRCEAPIWSPKTDEEVMTRTLAIMERRNVIGVVSGRFALLKAWRAAAPERVIFGVMPELPATSALTREIAAFKKTNPTFVIGELGLQYDGVSPADPAVEPIWKAAEDNDVPVALHMGPGPMGVAYMPGSGYRASLSSPLLLEPVLTRHPKLRVNIMHAGFPMLDDTLALLYAHPQVYVDTGVIVYSQPRPAFYRYLQTLVDAGFGERIMFGSDQMVWPETMDRAIDVIEAAPFLTPGQKRDILYNNAARFLRLDEATRARHLAMGA